MGKRIATIVMMLTILGCVFAGCKEKEPEEKVIRVMAQTDELPNMIQLYLEMHPEMGYTLAVSDKMYSDGDYEAFLDEMLSGKDEFVPDIYAVEEEYAAKYSKGSQASYAASYDDLGIPAEQLIQESRTAPYAVEIGTRPSDGKVIALPYMSGAGCMIYRRSIAKKVWGTDDPVVIQEKIGGGSGSWDAFWSAAEELKKNGYAIVSGDGDLWCAMRNSGDAGWVVEDGLYVAPERAAFLDASKRLWDNGYSNKTVDWTEEWLKDVGGSGEKEVFAYFEPAWFINFSMSAYYYCGDDPSTEEYEGTYGDWAVCNAPVGFYRGGNWVMANKAVADMEKKDVVADILKWITLDYDENSLQYLLANGLYEPYSGIKSAVVSGTVMDVSDGSTEFLGGQNMHEYYAAANKQSTGKYITEYDFAIDTLWRNAVREYAEGKKERTEAARGFADAVKDSFGFDISRKGAVVEK